jgi:hypothetical protein
MGDIVYSNIGRKYRRRRKYGVMTQTLAVSAVILITVWTLEAITYFVI